MAPPIPDPPLTTPPPWPHCGQGGTTDDSIGCRGVRVHGHPVCLAHLDETSRTAYLATLQPGADIDHRGTPFTSELLRQLLTAVHDPDTDRPRLGNASFNGASFSGDARFGRSTVSSFAGFYGGSLSWLAGFGGALFSGAASFRGASFSGDAWFVGVSFASGVSFQGASFSGDARFDSAYFFRVAEFREAFFSKDARFAAAAFDGSAEFSQTRFETAQHMGPLVCRGELELSGAVFAAPVTVEVVAKRVSLRRTRWESTAALRLRLADVDLTGAVLEYPLTLAVEPAPFAVNGGGSLPEEGLAGGDAKVRVTSVSGVDCAYLTLTDIDLAGCRFAGAVHLDQLHLDGHADFAQPPAGWHRCGPLLLRWSRRQVLVEEHHWRAAISGAPALDEPGATASWRVGPHHPHLNRTVGPRALAATYRQLRKALEDGKNEPDAADFYYGEMEMRRHDASRPRAERALLAVYWAVSGYGLRASRALAWLSVAMTATVLALVLWGLPVDEPKPTTTGRQVQAGQNLALTTDTPPPNNPTGPLTERLSRARLEKALRVVINSTVFRSSGHDLTTSGTYTEMASRFTEPVLLTLAVLAIRSRVKR